jgi:FKBP-type peptidyl-prolyl cis-trans isomerase SlyD
MTDTKLTVVDDLAVTLDYTLRLDDGQVIETTTGQKALEFLQGAGQLIPGLEQSLYGMAVGDEKEVEIAPADAYGEQDPDAFQLVPRDIIPADIELIQGMGLHLRDQSENVIEAYVADIRPDAVLFDFNHPLAGETLYFQVKISALRPATNEELTHGHVHSPGYEH